VAVAIAILASGLEQSAARTWVVPTDMPTIQEAVDAAAPRDSILVMPGTYERAPADSTGPLVRIDKPLTLSSAGGEENTVIDGGSSAPAEGNVGVLIENRLVKMSGFTVRNCYVGISVTGEFCTVIGNTLRENYYGATLSGYAVSFDRCTFLDNSVGLANLARGTSGLVDHNIFVGNGTGMVFESGGEIFVINNTICFSESAGIVVGNCSPLIENNVIYRSTLAGLKVTGLFPIWNFLCNDVYGCEGGNYVQIEDQTGANGNVSADPVFCDEENLDFGLCLDSPLVAQSCGWMGALKVTCGYCRTPVERVTWGRIKSLYAD